MADQNVADELRRIGVKVDQHETILESLKDVMVSQAVITERQMSHKESSDRRMDAVEDKVGKIEERVQQNTAHIAKWLGAVGAVVGLLTLFGEKLVSLIIP